MQVVAEQEAWKIAKSSGLDLVTILPNFVLGPVLSSRADGTSVGFLKVLGLYNSSRSHAQPLIIRGPLGMEVRVDGSAIANDKHKLCIFAAEAHSAAQALFSALSLCHMQLMLPMSCRASQRGRQHRERP